jgi:hypothetical protein
MAKRVANSLAGHGYRHCTFALTDEHTKRAHMVVHSCLVAPTMYIMCFRKGNTKRVPLHVQLALTEVPWRYQYLAYAVRP